MGKPNKLSRFWQELKRRRVIHVITVYASAAFVIIELLDGLTEPLNLPPNLATIVIIVLAVAFPLVVVLSWLYDLTGEGIEKTKPFSEIREEEEKAKVPNAWKIATYASFVVIVILIVLNIIPRSDLARGKALLDKSIAVLPFENLQSDSTQLWFTDGISDVISTQLAKISGLRLIGRTSTSEYKSQKKTIREIGEELSVKYILTGSVQKYNENIRIVPKLIRVENEVLLWSQYYDGSWDQIFDIQTDIANGVVANLETVLSPAELEKVKQWGTADPDAYTFYQKGNYLLQQLGGDAGQRAIEYFKQAIAIDSTFAEAYAGTAMAYCKQANWWGTSPTDSLIISLAEDWANRALEINGDLGEPHYVLGLIKYQHEWDWEGAEREFKKGMERNPNYLQGRISYANFLTWTRKFEESIRIGRESLDMDPLNPSLYGELGFPMLFCGREDEALEIAERGLELFPDNYFLLSGKAFCYLMKGISNQYVVEYTNDLKSRLKEMSVMRYGVLGKFLVLTGQRDEAVELLNELEYSEEYRGSGKYLAMGEIYDALGENEKAIDCFEKSYIEKEPFLFMINIRLVGESIYSNPRLIKLLENMGLR